MLHQGARGCGSKCQVATAPDGGPNKTSQSKTTSQTKTKKRLSQIVSWSSSLDARGCCIRHILLVPEMDFVANASLLSVREVQPESERESVMWLTELKRGSEPNPWKWVSLPAHSQNPTVSVSRDGDVDPRRMDPRKWATSLPVLLCLAVSRCKKWSRPPPIWHDYFVKCKKQKISRARFELSQPGRWTRFCVLLCRQRLGIVWSPPPRTNAPMLISKWAGAGSWLGSVGRNLIVSIKAAPVPSQLDSVLSS